MIKFNLLIFFLFLFFSCSKKEVLKMDLKIKDEFNSFEDIILDIALINISSNEIVIRRSLFPQDYSIKFELFSETKKLEYVGFYYKPKDNRPIILRTNEKISKSFNLSDYFAITPDKYRLIINYKSYNYESDEVDKIKIKKQINFTVKQINKNINKNTKLIKSILNNNFKEVKLLLRDGANPNILVDNKTAFDYIYEYELKHKTTLNRKILRLLSQYNARYSCQIITKKCYPFPKDFIEFNFVKSINGNNIDFIKHWIRVNKHQISMISLYPYISFVININKKRGKKVISEIDFLKLFHVDLFNVIENNITFLDLILKNHYNKEIIKYLRLKGAKRACEILNKKCD